VEGYNEVNLKKKLKRKHESLFVCCKSEHKKNKASTNNIINENNTYTFSILKYIHFKINVEKIGKTT
jgi:hypothetical protein